MGDLESPNIWERLLTGAILATGTVAFLIIATYLFSALAGALGFFLAAGALWLVIFAVGVWNYS